MDDRRAPPLRNPSRTAAQIAVVVLIVIAIAGFVLAGMKQRAAAPAQAVSSDATQESPGATTGAAAGPTESAEESAAGPNAVVFAPGSDRLSAAGRAKVERIAQAARKDHRTIAIAAKVEARSDAAEQKTLAKNRTVAVRQVLEAGGVPLGTMRLEISELPTGALPVAQANTVEIVLH